MKMKNDIKDYLSTRGKTITSEEVSYYLELCKTLHTPDALELLFILVDKKALTYSDSEKILLKQVLSKHNIRFTFAFYRYMIYLPYIGIICLILFFLL